MNKEDFNKIKQISKELNDIRLRNNLTEIQLLAEDKSFTHYDYHKEWNEVMFLTREGHKCKDCKIVCMKQDKHTSELEDMDYEEYVNYK